MRTPLVVGIGGVVAGVVVLGIAAATTSAAMPRVAVIDTGISPSAGLQQLDPGATCDPLCHHSDTLDLDGHGTAVASVVGKGVLVPVRIADSASHIEINAMTQAVKWVGAQGIPLATIGVTLPGQDHALDSAFSAAPNTLFIVSAGDDGIDIDQRHEPVMPCSSKAPNIICVTSEDSNGQPEDDANTGSQSVALSTDADNLPALTVNGTPTRVEGAAYAAAAITGDAVQLLAAQPDLTVAQLKQRLLDR